MKFNFLQSLQKVYIGKDFKKDISRFPIEIEEGKIIPAYVLHGSDVEGLILRFFKALNLIEFKFKDTGFYYQEKRDPYYIQFRAYFTGEKLEEKDTYTFKKVSLFPPVSYKIKDIISIFIKMGGAENLLVPDFMYVYDFFEVLSGVYLDFNRSQIYKKLTKEKESFYDVIKYIPWLQITSGIEINKHQKGVVLNNGSFFFNNLQTPEQLQNTVAIISKSIEGSEVFDMFIQGKEKLQYMLDLITQYYRVTFREINGVLSAKNITILQVSQGTKTENKLLKADIYHIIIKE